MLLQTESTNIKSKLLDILDIDDQVKLFIEEEQEVNKAIEKAMPSIVLAINNIVNSIQCGGRLIYIGAGTSGRIGVIDAAECYPTFSVTDDVITALIAGGKDAMLKAMEDAEDDKEKGAQDLRDKKLEKNDIVVGITASGNTPYVLGAIEFAKTVGCRTIGIANNSDSNLMHICSVNIFLDTGPELITGSTRLKAGTSQKLTLNMLSSITMARLGKVYGNHMVDMIATNNKLRGRSVAIICDITGIDADKASEILKTTKGNVKQALLQILGGVSPSEAQKMLKTSGEDLRSCLATVTYGGESS